MTFKHFKIYINDHLHAISGGKVFKATAFYSRNKLDSAAEKAKRVQEFQRDVAAVRKTLGR